MRSSCNAGEWTKDRELATGTCGRCRTLAPVPGATGARATSRSITSRGFMALVRQKMHESFSRSFGEFDIGVMSMDGKCFRKRCMLVAMGVGCQGNGLGRAVCRALGNGFFFGAGAPACSRSS